MLYIFTEIDWTVKTILFIHFWNGLTLLNFKNKWAIQKKYDCNLSTEMWGDCFLLIFLPYKKVLLVLVEQLQHLVSFWCILSTDNILYCFDLFNILHFNWLPILYLPYRLVGQQARGKCNEQPIKSQNTEKVKAV